MTSIPMPGELKEATAWVYCHHADHKGIHRADEVGLPCTDDDHAPVYTPREHPVTTWEQLGLYVREYAVNMGLNGGYNTAIGYEVPSTPQECAEMFLRVVKDLGSARRQGASPGHTLEDLAQLVHRLKQAGLVHTQGDLLNGRLVVLRQSAE